MNERRDRSMWPAFMGGLLLGLIGGFGAGAYWVQQAVQVLKAENVEWRHKANVYAIDEQMKKEVLRQRLEIRAKQVKGKAIELCRTRTNKLIEARKTALSDPNTVHALMDSPMLMTEFLKDIPVESIMKECLVEAESYFPFPE